MNVIVASYNLLEHKAYDEVRPITEMHDVDVFCLQECNDGRLEKHLGNLRLAGVAELGVIAEATYYNPSKLKLKDSQRFKLASARYERNKPAERYRLLLCRFEVIGTTQELVIGNIHLAHLGASNRARHIQLDQAFTETHQYRSKTPTLVMGDYNYPIPRNGLQRVARKHNFTEVGRSSRKTTYSWQLFRGKFDRAFATEGLSADNYHVLPFGKSDHAPIMVTIRTDRPPPSRH